MKVRNCALDVCWEEIQIDVFTSQPVMHLYARDLDDFRSLVTSRGSDVHVHICVNAQARLGKCPPRSYSANIGTVTTVSHRVEKTKNVGEFRHGKSAHSHKHFPLRG